MAKLTMANLLSLFLLVSVVSVTIIEIAEASSKKIYHDELLYIQNCNCGACVIKCLKGSSVFGFQPEGSGCIGSDSCLCKYVELVNE
ncbi:hypothetical protein PIB30_072219 [Stylosanthes scabra]|uniref:Uncharacterized protein n=1 Tax=Stylosanthes scabra TaxID=79078 RepID=A0ABU6WNV1_9FABA|nr:hypothetical protein [Stylosanthes scabra]